MSTRLAIIGIDGHQREWLEAAAALRDAGEIEIAGIGHHAAALARETAESLKSMGTGQGEHPAFDDLRTLLRDTSPQAILIDRPPNATMDFFLECLEKKIAIFSLGPPVETFAEAEALGEALGERSTLLDIFPRFTASAALRQCAQAEEFIRPIRFASASWSGLNYALLRARHPAAAAREIPIRSLSVLAWDAISTLIRLLGVPTSVYTAIHGTVGSGNSFADLSGAASATLYFPDNAIASLSLCDHIPPGAQVGRQLLLWGAAGTLRIEGSRYQFHDPEGKIIDRGEAVAAHQAPAAEAAEAIQTFLAQAFLPPSPVTGWELRLADSAAVMEAIIVSHRTGEPESPDKFRQLRR